MSEEDLDRKPAAALSGYNTAPPQTPTYYGHYGPPPPPPPPLPPPNGGDTNITLLPVIPVLNQLVADKVPLPVPATSELPHIGLNVDSRAADNLISTVDALVDTGAGATIGTLPFWEADVAQRPAILAEIYSCKDGKYVPMIMTGIVPEGEGFKLLQSYSSHSASAPHMSSVMAPG